MALCVTMMVKYEKQPSKVWRSGWRRNDRASTKHAGDRDDRRLFHLYSSFEKSIVADNSLCLLAERPMNVDRIPVAALFAKNFELRASCMPYCEAPRHQGQKEEPSGCRES